MQIFQICWCQSEEGRHDDSIRNGLQRVLHSADMPDCLVQRQSEFWSTWLGQTVPAAKRQDAVVIKHQRSVATITHDRERGIDHLTQQTQWHEYPSPVELG